MRMIDIAKLAGVSIATVSRVLNDPDSVKPDTRKKVEAVMRETNFIANAVARGLAVNSMKTIGVLTVDIRDLYYANVTYTIERRFTELGYNVLLSNTGSDLSEKEKYLRVMLENQVDGIILVGSVFREQTGNKHILAAAEKVPVVMANSFLEGNNIYSVICDDAHGIAITVDHLIQTGHKAIYYFNDIKSYSGLAKIEGFQAAMSRFGLPTENILKIERSINGGRDGVKKLITERRSFSAIITGEDFTAIGALKELSEQGIKVPDDVAVIGYNNSILAEAAFPSLTSVNNMVEAIANNTVQILYDVLQGNQVSPKIVLTPTLVVRESSK